MLMDFSTLAGLFAKNGAPLIGGLLQTAASAAGGPAAGAIAGVVLNAAAKALGATSADPGDIATAITADPAKAAVVLPQVESNHAAIITAQGQIDQAYLTDVQNARAETLALTREGSALAYGPVIISVLVVVAFFVDIVLLLKATLEANSLGGQAQLIFTGTLTAAFTSVVSYWLGSSSGSKDKDNQLAALTHAVVAPVPKKKSG